MPGNEAFLRPDVYTFESEVGAQPLALTGTAAAGFVDVATWGPIGQATLVTSPEDAYRKFGDDYSVGNLVRSLKNFFIMGGQRAYVSRVAKFSNNVYTATSSTATITDGGSGSDDLFRVDALYPGTRGDEISIVISNAVSATSEEPAYFDLTVLFRGVPVERYANVTLDEDDPNNIEARINADPSRQWLGSRYITVTNLLTTYAGEEPEEGTTVLTGGSNGDDSIGAEDYVGDPARYDGVYAFDRVDEIVNICHPGNTSVEVILGGLNYVYNWSFTKPPRTNMYVYDLPLGYEPQDALEFVRDDIANTTGYESAYYPWVKVGNRYDPVSPYMLGIWAKNDLEYGVWESPAGCRFPLAPVTGLAHECTLGEEQILHPHGINYISKRDYWGYVPWGARTLRVHTKFRYLAVRRFVNLIKKTLYNGGQQFVHRMNGPALWRQIEETADMLMRHFWSLGAFGGKPVKSSYYVKCDKTTNPPELIEQGICTCEIGMVPAKPAEYIVFNVLLYAEGALPLGDAMSLTE